jgi:Family of unknown function (DUF5908)
MPIEINELVLRIVVDQPANARPSNNPQERSAAREELVQQCVEAVLTVLHEKQER